MSKDQKANTKKSLIQQIDPTLISNPHLQCMVKKILDKAQKNKLAVSGSTKYGDYCDHRDYNDKYTDTSSWQVDYSN